MESLLERKCQHDRRERVHNYKAMCRVTVTFYTTVEGQFNDNYKSGREHAEYNAEDKVWDYLPKAFVDPSVEAECIEYELLGEEPPDED